MTDNPNITNPINRRQAIAGAGAAAGAMAITGPALAAGETDTELLALWREYLVALDRWNRALALSSRADDKCIDEARKHGSREYDRQRQNLRRKYGVAKLERTQRKLQQTVIKLEGQIDAAKAHGITGVAIKLALSTFYLRDEENPPTTAYCACPSSNKWGLLAV